MVDVSYDQELEYLRDSERGKPFPGLWIVLSGMDHERELEVMAHLDSGTETSLFDGQIGRAIGLDLSSAEILVFRSSTGAELAARLHAVRLAHDKLGEHDLTIAFSEHRITRNLLGRDFFNLFQIGFRERHLKILFSVER
jgi:hypothetical protein